MPIAKNKKIITDSQYGNFKNNPEMVCMPSISSNQYPRKNYKFNFSAAINVRKSTFETNSSSMHTMVLTNKDEYFTKSDIEEYINNFSIMRLPVDNLGRKYFPCPSENGQPYEFGRGFAIENDWKYKMAYVIASQSLFTDKENAGSYDCSGVICSQISNMIRKKLGIDIAGIYFPANTVYPGDVFDLDNEPLTRTTINDEFAYEVYGNIDHQSRDNVINIVNAMKKLPEYANFSEEECLFEIIFYKGIAIIEDSDESNTLDMSLVSGVLDSEKIRYVLRTDYDYKKDITTAYLVPVKTYISEEC